MRGGLNTESRFQIETIKIRVKDRSRKEEILEIVANKRVLNRVMGGTEKSTEMGTIQELHEFNQEMLHKFQS